MNNSAPQRSPAARRAAILLLLLALLFTPAACSRVQIARPAQVAGQEISVPLRIVEGPSGAVLALVPVSIQGQGPFPFALDTGASQSLIDRNLVDQLGLPIVGHSQGVTGIAGVTEADLTRVEAWSVGNAPLPAMNTITLDLPDVGGEEQIRGLLGSDILSEFGAITVDYERQVLILRSRQGTSAAPSPQR